MRRAWYLQTWFLCLVFMTAGFVLLILPIGLVLLFFSIKEDKKAKEILDKAGEINQYDAIFLDLNNKYAEKKGELEDDFQSQRAEKLREMGKLREEMAAAENRIAALKKEIYSLKKDYFVEITSVSAYENLRSDEVKNSLSLLDVRQKDMIRKGRAIITDPAFSGKQKVIDAQRKQILLCFNLETTSIIESVTAKNVDSCRSKLQRAFETINKIFSGDGVQISEEYLKSKFEELSLVYAYMVKCEEEKELQREIREQLKEEEKIRREIEREKLRIEKEEAQFKNEISKLMSYMQKATDIEKQLYVDKINELNEKLALLEKDKENVLELEQNTRAGFVYIISNIGAFGEDIYKIGMTRRLEPMERIRELSSASVPFPFDVHAIVFSEDAPKLEAVLHQTFRDTQVNKVNSRKEFFKIGLEEIKKIVKENHNATVQFVDIPDALEYRESLRITGGCA